MARRRMRHTPEQIIRKLQQADGLLAVGKTIGQLIQVLEVIEQTFHRWRNQYGGMKAEEAKRLKNGSSEKCVLRSGKQSNLQFLCSGSGKRAAPFTLAIGAVQQA
jgi:putative transposase